MSLEIAELGMLRCSVCLPLPPPMLDLILRCTASTSNRAAVYATEERVRALENRVELLLEQRVRIESLPDYQSVA